MLGLKSGGDPVQVVQVEIKPPNQLLDLEEVPPVVAPAQIIPDGELGSGSEVGSGGEFINGNVKWSNIGQDLHARSGGLGPHWRHWKEGESLQSVKFS